ncbi:MAG TPA: nicotinate phosphoribosyltransferase [Acidimicrobiales bacterium]
MTSSTAFLTDQYELTMLDGALRSGVASHRASFEVFARQLPPGRRYGVVAGTGRLLEALERFRFTDDHLGWLASRRVVSPEAIGWLREYRFSGDVRGFVEGELYFPDSPVLTVDADFGEAVLLETLVLSILNHDSAVASAAARMVAAANGRPLIEMGSRRTHEAAAVAAARAAYLAGFASTSNLEAGRRYDVPTAGTSAHAFTLAHADESAAFTAQMEALGPATTLLVDTYDVERGLRAAVLAARELDADGPGAVRIDSGDLARETRRARRLLDELGAPQTAVVVSGDLDEYRIAELEKGSPDRAPIDAYGVGTRVVTGSGAPTAELIFKLVAIAEGPGADAPMRAVAKRSEAKVTVGGCKTAARLLDASGRVVGDEVVVGPCPAEGPPPEGADVQGAVSRRSLQVPLVQGGVVVHAASLEDARAHHRAAVAELPPSALDLAAGPPAVRVYLIRDRD